MKSLLNVGIDVGSTTIKLVVLDHEKNILYKNYARHFSEIGNALQENLTQLKSLVGEKKFTFALTGSAGMGIAQRIGLPFVQEVIACAAAVKNLIPQTDTVVELGGEDAKITYFGEAPEQRMNGVCCCLRMPADLMSWPPRANRYIPLLRAAACSPRRIFRRS